MQNRPTGRQKNITGYGKNIKRRGSGLGTGPVGKTGRTPQFSSGGTSRRSSTRSGGSFGGGKLIWIILALLLGGGGGIGTLLSGGSQTPEYTYTPPSYSYQEYTADNYTTPSSGSLYEYFLGDLGGGTISTGWDTEANTQTLDTSVASGAREKYTTLLGNGKGEVTLMVYLCGTDLESRSQMATKDLQEMLNAGIGENVNLIVYTGGCKQWQNSVLSSKNNQIWQITGKGMVCLEDSLSSVSMTDPDTLSSFIQWCAKNFPASRNALIFWDHGGGSVSGFGYDEKFTSSGSMDLAEIDRALTDGGVKFDFVGFDACLMATAENALMLSKHADYMIASEETEPGIGWYYTNWLSKLSQNTSVSTLELGKQIIDDFVQTCAQSCAGQSTTLSLVDLAEAETTIPKALAAFAEDTCEQIQNNGYAQVSNARSDTREFGASSRIDQVDLVHLAKNMDTPEGDALAQALLGAVKYNRTSSNMTNSYGLSIYFPFRKASMVDQAVDTYEQIGMDDEYMRCIQAFASMEVSGQAAAGGTASPLPTLMGFPGSGTSTGSSTQMLEQLLGAFLGGDVSSITGLTGENTSFLTGRALDTDTMAAYIAENRFDGSLLSWQYMDDGMVISLPEEQWSLVQTLHANMFYDDGEGYLDLGMDTVYEFDDAGNLLAPTEITWIAVNEQPVAYYHESTVQSGESYSITGRIPVLYNGERAELVAVFSDEDPHGSIVGVRRVYQNGETETVAKTMDAVMPGDMIDFVCDYYSYDGQYLDSYLFGEQLVVGDTLYISDVYIDADAANLTYQFTDIYNREYWTPPVQ